MRWGGRRPGAGRKRAPDSGIPHRSRPSLSSVPAHVTLRVQPDVRSLRKRRVVDEVERTFSDGRARPGFRLVHYSLQGNHVHLIVEARNRTALGRGMMGIGTRLARAINRAQQRAGRVFTDRYHLHVLRTPREVRHALRYVLLNRRKHGQRLGRTVRLDPASSARWFDGWRRSARAKMLAVDTPAPAVVPVARARTWLLTTGWRRHGLIDPAEVPG